MRWEYLNVFIEIDGKKPPIATLGYEHIVLTYPLIPRCDIEFHDGIFRKITKEENVIQQYVAGVLAATVVYTGQTTQHVMRMLQTMNWERSVNQAITHLKDI